MHFRQLSFSYHQILSHTSGSHHGHLLRLLHTPLRGRTVQPQRHKCQPSGDRDPDASNPDPCAGDLPTPWPLVVRKVADSDLSLLIDICEEGAAIVDAEVEDTVLIGSPERDAEDGGICGLCDRGKV